MREEVLSGIADLGFENATEIQEKAIPHFLKGNDILATSATGSGKTAAFAIPILNQLSENRKDGIRALILAPTRELAQQIDEQFWVLGYHTGISSVTVYGGSDWSAQEKALKQGVNIVVATPGRLLDQMKIHNYDFSGVEIVVLDEADRMLDMGFIPDVRSILNRMPKERQTVLFSATMTPKVEMIAKEFTKGQYERIKIGMPAPAKGINQVCYNVDERLKVNLIVHLYEKQKWSSAIIFVGTKRGVDQLTRALHKKGAEVESIHGDRDQKEREATLEKFRSKKTKILVATDVMARGIDVDNISHVINYDVPNDADDYIHRIGRTARAESTGDAITLVSRQDTRKMKDIFRAVDSYIKMLDVPEEVLGTSDERSGRRDSRPEKTEERQDGRQSRQSRGRQGDRKKRDDKPQRGPKKVERSDEKQPEKETKGRDQRQKKQSRKPRDPKRPPRKQADRAPRDKHIQKQEKLIEQVQQSSIQISKDDTSNKKEKKGLWGKITGLFK